MDTNKTTVTRESKMKVTTPNLIRAAGLSAMVAGTIFAVIQPITRLTFLRLSPPAHSSSSPPSRRPCPSLA